MYTHPWKRFGHDRLYVHLDDETSIGYWDRTTDELHPASAKHAEALAAFIAEWRQQNGEISSTAAPQPADHLGAVSASGGLLLEG